MCIFILYSVIRKIVKYELEGTFLCHQMRTLSPWAKISYCKILNEITD